MAEGTRPGRLLAFRNDRLGARLITLVNAMRLSSDFELPLAVHWNQATDIGRVFNDPLEFFDTGFVRNHFIDEAEWKAVRNDTVRIGNLLEKGAAGLRETLDSGRDVLIDNAFGLIAFADEDAEVVKSRVAALLADFPFAESLTPSLRQIADTVSGGTAYHIRRGDLISFPRAMHRSWPRKYVPDEIYMLHIERVIARGARPVIFSDDPGAIRRFKTAYPQLVAAEELFDVTRLTEGQRDLMELYAMSRCAKIVAPAQSAFSSTAADLGGATKIEVGEDLSEGEKEAALERLATRLSDPTGRDIAAEEGDLGQSFIHVSDHLTATGRAHEATAALGKHLEAGLNISFLYPQQLEMQLRNRDFQGAVKTGALMRDRLLYHRIDHAVGEVLHGIAHIAAGNVATGLHHITNGFWHEPDGVLPRTVVGMLLELGVLNDTNFLPMSPAARKLRRRAVRNAASDPRLIPLAALAPARSEALTSVPGLDPIMWDWGGMMRSFSVQSVQRHPHRAGYEKALGKLDDGPDADSLRAVYQSHIGNLAEGLRLLEGLARDHAGEAVVHARLSQLRHAARDAAPALEAARRVVELAPDIPAYRAWLGMMQIRLKDHEGAACTLGDVLAKGFRLPAIRGSLAQALHSSGQHDAALAELGLAIADSPSEQRFRFDRAAIHHVLEAPERALDDLNILFDMDKRAPKIIRLMVASLTGLGRDAEALETLASGLERNPDNDILTSLQEKLQATGAGV